MFKLLINVIAMVATVLAVAAVGEGMLRVRNRDQMSYSVEMWRYSKELKRPDAQLGHVHVPGATARLQNVDIAINSWGLRGPEPLPAGNGKIRILFLGSSITLGWGVPQDQILTSLLQQRLGPGVEVLNAGIGNYSAERYVGLFETRLQGLHPDVIVVHYFVSDATVLPPASSNWIIRNSELALMLWQAGVNLTEGRSDLTGLVDRYRALYAPDSEGRQRMEAALADLNRVAHASGIKVILAMMPDIHSLNPYPFGFVHDHMREVAARLGWTYVDLSDGFTNVTDARSLYAIPGDPHPNPAGHAIMADVLAPVLRRAVEDRSGR